MGYIECLKWNPITFYNIRQMGHICEGDFASQSLETIVFLEHCGTQLLCCFSCFSGSSCLERLEVIMGTNQSHNSQLAFSADCLGVRDRFEK